MKNKRPLKMSAKEEERLAKIFSMMRKRENIILADKKMHFNQTELRMLSEIISANYEGKRLISTNLAKRLGITRSAISQIVNRLEAQGVVKRVADEVDRKIAYIEISEDILDMYGEDIKNSVDFINRLVEEFGEENFNRMYELFVAFTDLAEQKLKEVKKSKTKALSK